jgi:hypothetical protein
MPLVFHSGSNFAVPLFHFDPCYLAYTRWCLRMSGSRQEERIADPRPQLLLSFVRIEL